MGNRYLFGKPKKNYTTIKVIAGAAVLAVAIAVFMNLPDGRGADLSDDTNLIANAGTSVSDRENNNTDRAGSDEEANSKNNVVTNGGEAYYLLKEAEGQIELYHYDENGSEKFIRMTDIPFSLISAADQELFKEGIVLKSESELDSILQDFES